MYSYLRQHPDVFMPFLKEPHYFGTDLTHRYGKPSRAEYLSLFADARPGQRVGEASAWYLYSRTAAAEIAEFSPRAQIIIMLRNPVDMMYAQHSQLLFNRQEDIDDFEAALAAELDRRGGRRLPRHPVRTESLFYRDSARFAPQIERYLAPFGRERVHFIVQEEMKQDTASAYRGVLRFLGVDQSFEADFERANENKLVRKQWLQEVIWSPPGPIRSAIPILRRFPIVHRLRGALLQINSIQARRPPIGHELRAKLIAEFRDDIARVEELVGRDLSLWYRDGEIALTV